MNNIKIILEKAKHKARVARHAEVRSHVAHETEHDEHHEPASWYHKWYNTYGRASNDHKNHQQFPHKSYITAELGHHHDEEMKHDKNYARYHTKMVRARHNHIKKIVTQHLKAHGITSDTEHHAKKIMNSHHGAEISQHMDHLHYLVDPRGDGVPAHMHDHELHSVVSQEVNKYAQRLKARQHHGGLKVPMGHLAHHKE